MTEIRNKESVNVVEQVNQLDLLFEIYSLKKVRKKLTSKLKSLEKLLKSGRTLNIDYKFEALKVIITENSTQLRDLLPKIDAHHNVFDLTKSLNECELYFDNLMIERKKKHIDLETFELTKGHYLKQILDIQDSIRQLKINASAYSQELRNELIELEDQRIRFTTEKMRRNITKEDFKKKKQKLENQKENIEEKLAFLKVEIIDLNLGVE